ncbi:tetratricopeptide repeat protein [Marinobacter sp. C2H3]|uniref:tetratricopeptide repeat protein n=1 Tax=Marinobacter sp. C2H3 TaxID=3119003 RepID=UPI00300F0EA6
MIRLPAATVSLIVLMLANLAPSQAAAQEAFQVQLDRDGETIGDMRPVFLKFESRPLPAISPEEVGRRYLRLFETSKAPDVRVDAFNRLANIRARSGRNVGYRDDQEAGLYREALDSYQAILDQGRYAGRLDELLYQMAKAHALVGEPDAATERLEQLVGLYPKSSYATEARFRIAEADFAAGRYTQAASGYRAVIASGGDASGQALATKARYMLGWSQFKQGPATWADAARTFASVLDETLPDAASLNAVPTSSVDTLDDTLRILAVMAQRKEGLASLDAWLGETEPRPWTGLVYDRLADLYATEGQPDKSVAVNEAFVRRYPGQPFVADFRAQTVAVWTDAGQPTAVRHAKASFVAAYRGRDAYQGLPARHQSRWRDYARTLADTAYAKGSAEQGANRVTAFDRAADYYEALANRATEPGPVWRLAGDARLQAGEDDAAIRAFRTAGYEVPGYAEAADAAWAAVAVLRRNAPDGPGPSSAEAQPDPAAGENRLAALSSEVTRFSGAYPQDGRLPAVQADLANRWLALGDRAQALAWAGRVLDHRELKAGQRYDAWLVTARVQQADGEWSMAERAWQNALAVLDEQRRARGQDAGLDHGQRPALVAQLATVIYQQGRAAAGRGDVDEAVRHFRRIQAASPGSETAVRGEFDAANTLLRARRWPEAIDSLEAFRRAYPEHDLSGQIPEKLVYAYSESGQPVRAADELVAQANRASAPWPMRLRAAELYHNAGAVQERDALYRAYLDTAPVPDSAEAFVQTQTFRHRLATSAGNDEAARRTWQASLVSAELGSPWHSEDTLAWSADAALVMGVRAAERFEGIALKAPLAEALDRKQAALEAARERFMQADQLGGDRHHSEVLFRRAELYRQLAADLMASEVPDTLSEMEAAQYQMLLEEQAYPFEEKAIDLHAQNHQGLRADAYDPWIERSLAALAKLNPGRYQRGLRWMTWSGEGQPGA